MKFTIGPGSPPYLQVRERIESMIASGELPVGTRLPPVRQLAADLDLANGTVARAYRELEEAGWVITEGRRGTFVAGVPDDLDDRRQVEEATERLAVVAARAGMNADQVRKIVDEVLARFGLDR